MAVKKSPAEKTVSKRSAKKTVAKKILLSKLGAVAGQGIWLNAIIQIVQFQKKGITLFKAALLNYLLVVY